MYTVGLIDKQECLRTFNLDSLAEAKEELKYWRDSFMNNNVVKRRSTVIEREETDEIKSVKEIFILETYKTVIMFLCKNG